MPTFILALRALLLTFSLVFLLPGPAMAENISVLGARPDWSRLEIYQRTVTKEEFQALLNRVFAPGGTAAQEIQVKDTYALVRKSGEDWFKLEFASSPEARKAAPRYWRTPAEVPLDPRKPLKGLHIALDPGHIGGPFAKMEERWFRIGQDKPIVEGDMTLTVARHLEKRLEGFGARVSYIRKSAAPVTSLRPEDLQQVALQELRRRGIENPPAKYASPKAPNRGRTIQGTSEQLFYRSAEISARAELVNKKLKPDLVLCIHFNAEGWGDPDNPTLTAGSHLHLLIQGAYSADELAFDDQRFEMLIKLLNGTHAAEVMLSKPVAAAMARATNLPPYRYLGSNAAALPGQPYIWKRNLRANRLYECPTVFLEPYIMNNRLDYTRMQMGDYEGERPVEGQMRKSIYREYADSVTEGLVTAMLQVPGRQ